MKTIYQNYYFDIKNQYHKNLNLSSKKNNGSQLNKIIAGISAIERYNRIILWRLFEYIALILNYLKHITFESPLINYSIGSYQIKIEYILQQCNIEYSKYRKLIYLKNKLTIKEFVRVIYLSNKYITIESCLKKNFGFNDWDKLNRTQIKEIALFYSRNIEFDGMFNYFTILYCLYFGQKYLTNPEILSETNIK